MRRLLLAIGLGVALALLIGWLWFGWWAQRAVPVASNGSPPATGTPAAPADAGAGETRRIRATLYYVADNGAQLVGVDREVPYAEGPVDQARRLIEALVAPVEPPLAQAIPSGTTLQTLFLTSTGEAFVDFSPEIATNHPGGSLDELLTVYAIVNTLTVNLPAVTQVQILVGGKEVDTLAGHVDLRRPLVKNLAWARPPEGQMPADPAAPATPPVRP